MNGKKILLWIAGFLAGLFFVWLALRGLDLSRVGAYLSEMKKGWIIPFVVVSFAANALRGLRWRLLFQAPERIPAWPIITATLAGYAANVAVPRLGEVSRCGYLAKRTPVTLGEAVASVVIERTIDVVTLLVLLLAVMLFTISDPETVTSLLGMPAAHVYRILGGVLGGVFAAGLAVYLLHRNKARFDRAVETIATRLPVTRKLFETGHHMLDGLVAVKHLQQWPRFILYTGGIWLLYACMSWIPFFAFDEPALNSLSLLDAFDVMVISSIGVVIPSPSGVGTYHFFTQKALTLLHGVSPEAALSYAVVAHAVMIGGILITAAVAVATDRLILKKS